MNNIPLSNSTVSFGLSLALASVFNGLLVIIKEKIPAVMAAMQHFTGHHWISHSVIVLILFVSVGGIFTRLNRGQGPKISIERFIGIVMSGVGIGSFTIIGFYLING